jgi:DTW domain-containing protein YfiP
MHPRESKSKKGTGRMTHLCISNSRLIEGVDFTSSSEIEDLLSERGYAPMVLYPGRDSLRLNGNLGSELKLLMPPDKVPLIFVIDATWSMAKKMLKLSRNLHTLPRISFEPGKISDYRIRVQPDAQCLSTIESVHRVIEILESKGFLSCDPKGGQDILVKLFSRMVDAHLEYAKSSVGGSYRNKPPGTLRVRKSKKWEKRSLFYKGKTDGSQAFNP